ncbi:BTB/POZ domain protein [Necator americanus]|uniref:BTB/POZ domain protein n=1 Tax=Necator americanus TaxID=51031 RepID=W2TXB5_NECAM|nr:BTB/POZ domain protein [Necator americanus]ETN85672.1 BTB/POZ domain protein [Necator americanus]
MGSLSDLDLLREEHLKLQSKYEQLQQHYGFLQAKVDPGQSPEISSLAGELFATMKNLFEHHTFSDIVIHVGGRDVKCHKFLLMTRSHHWNDLESCDSIEISDSSIEAFEVVYRWMYTDTLPQSKLSDNLLQEVCRIAFRYHFSGLQARCVQLLKSRVDVNNCISLYDFADIENVFTLVNVLDQTGLSPLELALTTGHINMANQLLSKNANCNAVDESGKSILM